MKCLSLCILIMIERDLVRHSFLNIFLFCHTVIVFLSKWSIGPRKRLLIQQKVNLLCRGKLIFNMSPVKYVSFDVWIQTIINIKGCSYNKDFELPQYTVINDKMITYHNIQNNCKYLEYFLSFIHRRIFCRISILVAAHDNLVNHPRKLKMLLKTYSEKKDGQKS